MAEKIRVEVELPVEQVEALLASSKVEGTGRSELSEDQLASIIDKIRGEEALDEAEAAIIRKIISKASSKLQSKQVQRVVADVVSSTVVDTVVTAVPQEGGRSEGPKK